MEHGGELLYPEHRVTQLHLPYTLWFQRQGHRANIFLMSYLMDIKFHYETEFEEAAAVAVEVEA
jgi:hypothetical protein